ncbi:polysaccharide pyruvyl transferase family protein [Microbacterium sp. 179-I 1D1 NHS]|uniref:polysaccharide pyruvyl transferase family protein n=1 Tax=unclassified Microbacterium TaxID=2609290 RepID=UPI00387A3838
MTASEQTALRTAFYSISAQDDNLGDLEIRRIVLGWILPIHKEVVVYTGSMSKTYMDAFPQSSVRFVSNPLLFQLLFLRHAVTGDANLVYAPGPQRVGTRRSLRKGAINLLNLSIARIRGGRSIAIGRAFSGSTDGKIKIDRSIARSFDLITVRDHASGEAVGTELRVAPDVAFAAGNSAPDNEQIRSKICFSLRGDRNLNHEMVAALVRSARQLNWDVEFVTQVKRDDVLHQQLAEIYHADLVAWTSEPHLIQLKRVSSAYGKAAVVVTNRLHAALFATNAGAVPVAVEDGTRKLQLTLAPWLSMPILTPETPTLDLERVAALSGELSRQRSVAQSELEQIQREAAAILQMTDRA